MLTIIGENLVHRVTADSERSQYLHHPVYGVFFFTLYFLLSTDFTVESVQMAISFVLNSSLINAHICSSEGTRSGLILRSAGIKSGKNN